MTAPEPQAQPQNSDDQRCSCGQVHPPAADGSSCPTCGGQIRVADADATPPSEQAGDAHAAAVAADWLPISPIVPKPDPQTPYPLDALTPLLREAVAAAHALTGAPLAMLAGTCLGSAALLVQGDYDVQTLAPGRPKPTSLNIFAIAPSGARKSTAFDLAMAGHANADAEVDRRWRRVGRGPTGGAAPFAPELADRERLAAFARWLREYGAVEPKAAINVNRLTKKIGSPIGTDRAVRLLTERTWADDRERLGLHLAAGSEYGQSANRIVWCDGSADAMALDEAPSPEAEGEQGERERRRSSPRALRRNATIEALGRCLERGRWSQALATSEGSLIIGNWSMAAAQLRRTLADYNGLWSDGSVGRDRAKDGGLEIYASGRRLTQVLMVQPDAGLEFVSKKEMAAGTAARALLSFDAAHAERIVLSDAERDAAGAKVNEFAELVERVRSRQDVDAEFETDVEPKRLTIWLNADGREALDDANRVWLERLHAEPSEIAQTILNRAAEQTARIAAVQVAVEAYADTADAADLELGADEIDAAARIVEWYIGEWARALAMGDADQAAKDAVLAWDAIGDAYRKKKEGGQPRKKVPLVNDEGQIAVRTALNAYRPTKALSGERRDAAIKRLEIEDRIRSLGRGQGRHVVNPHAVEGGA